MQLFIDMLQEVGRQFDLGVNLIFTLCRSSTSRTSIPVSGVYALRDSYFSARPSESTPSVSPFPDYIVLGVMLSRPEGMAMYGKVCFEAKACPSRFSRFTRAPYSTSCSRFASPDRSQAVDSPYFVRISTGRLLSGPSSIIRMFSPFLGSITLTLYTQDCALWPLGWYTEIWSTFCRVASK